MKCISNFSFIKLLKLKEKFINIIINMNSKKISLFELKFIEILLKKHYYIVNVINDLNNVSIIICNHIFLLLIESYFGKIVKIRSKNKILFNKLNMRNKIFQLCYLFSYVFFK